MLRAPGDSVSFQRKYKSMEGSMLQMRARPCRRDQALHRLRRRGWTYDAATALPTKQQNQRGKLKLFLDTASFAQYERWLNSGLFYGVVTTPISLQEAGVRCQLSSLAKLVKKAAQFGAEEVHVHAWGENVKQITSSALDLAGIDVQRVVVTLPITIEGVRSAALLCDREKEVRVALTALFSRHQVLAAQAVQAEYAVTMLDRINLHHRHGYDEVVAMQKIVNATSSPMRILVSGPQNLQEVADLATQGCNTFTLSPAAASAFFNDQITLATAADFETAAATMGAYAEDNGTLA